MKKKMIYNRPCLLKKGASPEYLTQCMDGSGATGADDHWTVETNSFCGSGSGAAYDGYCVSGSVPNGTCAAGGNTGQCVAGSGNASNTHNYFGLDICHSVGSSPSTTDQSGHACVQGTSAF